MENPMKKIRTSLIVACVLQFVTLLVIGKPLTREALLVTYAVGCVVVYFANKDALELKSRRIPIWVISSLVAGIPFVLSLLSAGLIYGYF